MKGRSLRYVLTLAAICSALLVATAWAGPFTFQKGDIVVGVGLGHYKVFDPVGNLLTTLDTTSGSSEDTGGAFDSNDNLIVTNFEANSVSEFDKNGNLINPTFGSGYNFNPESVTFDHSGHVFIGQADGNAQVLEFNSTGTALLNSFSPMRENRGTDWIDMGPDGHTLFYTSEGHNIMRFDTATSTQLSNFATGLPGPTAYALKDLPNGDVLVADTNQVLLLGTNGAIIRSYTDPSLVNAFALNILPDGKSFITANIDSTGEIFQFNIATGALEQTIFPSPSSDVAGLIVFGELGVGPPPTAPEPGTLLLVGTGAVGLAGLVRRRMIR